MMNKFLTVFFLSLIIPTVKAQKIEVVNNTPSAILGEGAIWNDKDKTLYWVDITGQKLFRYNPKTEEHKSFNMPGMIGTIVPAKSNYAAVVALETGLYGITTTSELTLLVAFPDEEIKGNRFNDGKCDPLGRFWVGTMNKQAVRNAGNLYCFDGSAWQKKQEKTTISNGMAWSLDGNTFYYIDTAEFSVFAYNFNQKSGEITNKRVAIKIPREIGGPDGMTIDSEGMLWIAHWGGSAVIRWNPDNGEMLQKITVPAPHVTSCAFGDDDLKTLYITTAREGLSEQQLKTFPLSGCLFKVRSNVSGIQSYEFQSKTKKNQ